MNRLIRLEQCRSASIKYFPAFYELSIFYITIAFQRVYTQTPTIARIEAGIIIHDQINEAGQSNGTTCVDIKIPVNYT